MYFSAHRAPMKPSFILNRHLIFVLYFTKFHEIPFRGRLLFCLVSDLVQNIMNSVSKIMFIMYASHV